MGVGGYEDPSQQQNKRMYNKTEISYKSSPTASENTEMDPTNDVPSSSAPQTDPPSTVEEGDTTEPLPEIKYEDEVDKLLDGMGPRYADWPGCDPLPVDGDLLPGIAHGYQPPFSLLPYGVNLPLEERRQRLYEGRSRQHQGLATTMIKLWKRCSIAKIALQCGVQLTTSERMAEEIKVTVVRNEEGGSSVTTVVLRGSTDSILEDLERAVDDGVNMYKALCRDSQIVPGAAATEIELARRLKEFSFKETG